MGMLSFVGYRLSMTEVHLHVLSVAPASGKTVITTGIIRSIRDRGDRVLPFKPVAETVLRDGSPQLPEAVDHQCFAAGAAVSPEMWPVRVIPMGREADVWLYGDYLGKVPRLGRDMPVLAALPSEARAAVSRELAVCRAALLDRCEVLVSEGAGSATALSELGIDDPANVSVGTRAGQVLLVARATSGTAITALDRGIEVLRGRSVNVTGFLLNDVPGCIDEHVGAAAASAERTGVPFVGVMPWSDFFEGREKYSPPSQGCAEDHRHIADLVASALDLELLESA